MLDGFLVIFIAVAIPAYILVWIVGNSRKKKSDREQEEGRALTDKWLSVLTASPEERTWAANLVMYNPEDGDIVEQLMPTPEKMASYYFDKLGLAEDFRAIYGQSWREHVRIEEDPSEHARKYSRIAAVWSVDGFRASETPELEKAIAALLLSKRGRVVNASAVNTTLNITAVPNDRKPWANRWLRRIEHNIRAAGFDVDLYVCTKEYEGYKHGAFLAPGPYLCKLDEQEDEYENT